MTGRDNPGPAPAEEAALGRPEGYLESLDRSGRVTGRLAVDRLPLHVGRAYTNDLIVDDPFVDAVHLRIERAPDGRIQAVDLASTNGLYRHGGRTRVASAVLDDSGGVRIGHSVVRYRPLGWEAPPTRVDRAGKDLLRLFEMGWSQAGLVLLAVAVVVLDTVLGRATRPELLELIFLVTGVVGILLVWAGFWSLINRLLQHRMNFLVHVSIASLALVLSNAGDTFAGYLTYLMDWDASYVWWVGGLGVLLLSAVLYWHLRFCTIARPATLVRILGAITLVLYGLVGLQDFMQRYLFSGAPQYQVTFKAIPWQLRGPLPLGAFIDEAEALRWELATQRREAGI